MTWGEGELKKGRSHCPRLGPLWLHWIPISREAGLPLGQWMAAKTLLSVVGKARAGRFGVLQVRVCVTQWWSRTCRLWNGFRAGGRWLHPSFKSVSLLSRQIAYSKICFKVPSGSSKRQILYSTLRPPLSFPFRWPVQEMFRSNKSKWDMKKVLTLLKNPHRYYDF